MKAVRIPIWLRTISNVFFVILISSACTPLTSDPEKSIDSTVSILETDTSQLATQITEQKQTNIVQQDAISDLSSQMPAGFELITKTLTPLSLSDAPTPFPVCTPPACEPDEIYHCPGSCPGGCGTTCATATPGLPSGTGHIFGEICYPGETMPEMMIYLQETRTGQTLKIFVPENQDSYQLEVQAGVYVAFAWLQNKEAGGGYTQYVRCKKTILPCTDHSLVPFLVQENHVTVDVDICDWDGETTLFPAVP